MMNPHDPRSVMGYPSLNGYPPPNGPPPPAYPMPYHNAAAYASPYQPYANPAANPKDDSSQSFNMWYASDKYGQWAPEPTNSQKFARLMFTTMVTLIISLCMVSLVVWLLFGTDVPDFQLSHFSVSNLSLVGPTVEANWCINMTAKNVNSDLKRNAGSIKASILYKDFPLAMSNVDPIYTRGTTEGENRINMFFVMERQKTTCKTDLATELLLDKNAGNLILSLRLALGDRFSSHGERKHDFLRIFCEDIKLAMISKGLAGITEDSPRGCLIFA